MYLFQIFPVLVNSSSICDSNIFCVDEYYYHTIVVSVYIDDISDGDEEL